MMAPFVTPIMTKPMTSSQKHALFRSTFQPMDTVTTASGERSAFACSTWPAPKGSSPTSLGRVRNVASARGSDATRQMTASSRNAGRQP